MSMTPIVLRTIYYMICALQWTQCENYQDPLPKYKNENLVQVCKGLFDLSDFRRDEKWREENRKENWGEGILVGREEGRDFGGCRYRILFGLDSRF